MLHLQESRLEWNTVFQLTPRVGLRDCGFVQELGASFNENDEIPAGMEDEVAKWREALLEAAVEIDDAAMEAYLEVRPAN